MDDALDFINKVENADMDDDDLFFEIVNEALGGKLTDRKDMSASVQVSMNTINHWIAGTHSSTLENREVFYSYVLGLAQEEV